jgi:hypothetical protein
MNPCSEFVNTMFLCTHTGEYIREFFDPETKQHINSSTPESFNGLETTVVNSTPELLFHNDSETKTVDLCYKINTPGSFSVYYDFKLVSLNFEFPTVEFNNIRVFYVTGKNKEPQTVEELSKDALRVFKLSGKNSSRYDLPVLFNRTNTVMYPLCKTPEQPDIQTETWYVSVNMNTNEYNLHAPGLYLSYTCKSIVPWKSMLQVRPVVHYDTVHVLSVQGIRTNMWFQPDDTGVVKDLFIVLTATEPRLRHSAAPVLQPTCMYNPVVKVSGYCGETRVFEQPEEVFSRVVPMLAGHKPYQSESHIGMWYIPLSGVLLTHRYKHTLGVNMDKLGGINIGLELCKDAMNRTGMFSGFDPNMYSVKFVYTCASKFQ